MNFAMERNIVNVATTNNPDDSTRGSWDSNRRGSHLSRILILFSLLLIISFVFIVFAVAKKKSSTTNNTMDPMIKNDIYTPPTLLA